MQKFFVSISAIFAAVPGFAIMWQGIGIPPEQNFLFGGVIETIGSLSLVLLWMNRAKIKKIKSNIILRFSILFAVLSICALVTYLFLYNLCVISHPTNHTVFFPLWTTGELNEMIANSGGRWAALDEYGWFGVYSEVQKSPSWILSLTVAILLFFYQSIFTGLTVAFGLVGFHKGLILAKSVG